MKERLEIFVITYNRAKELERTLRSLAVEPIRECKITVLDNHSTDDTPDVCAKAKQWLPNLVTIRHPKNIGGDANNLRAIELSQATFTWVICDDDGFDFSNAGDIWKAILDNQADIISLKTSGSDALGKEYVRGYMISKKGEFLLHHTFTPCAIVRTSLFDSECIAACYRNFGSMFPQFPLFERAIRTNTLVYFSHDPVVTKGAHQGYSPFGFMAGWLMSIRSIEFSAVRQEAINQVFGRGFWKTFSYSLMIENRFRRAESGKALKTLRAEAWNTSLWLGLKVSIAAKTAHLPQWALEHLWGVYASFKSRHHQPIPICDEIR